MANILGISAYYHDSAAALLHDGDIIAAAQEERFSPERSTIRVFLSVQSAIALQRLVSICGT